MAFFDVALTATLVIAAFFYMIKHFMSSGNGCGGCSGCSKNETCAHVLPMDPSPKASECGDKNTYNFQEKNIHDGNN